MGGHVISEELNELKKRKKRKPILLVLGGKKSFPWV